MSNQFSSQVPRSNEAFELLPLFHTCDGLDARNHILNSSINTSDTCEVFKENITYLFYGRPAFKYDTKNSLSRDISLYPTAFVMNAENIGGIKRIYPFDSGAMHHKRYEDYFNRKMTVLDFELEPITSRISDVVLHFFGSNENYLNFKTNDINNEETDFEAHSFLEMVRSLSNSKADERRATIELQAHEVVKLGPNSLKAIIVPTALRDTKLIKNFAESNEVIIESYDVAVWNPAQCFGLIQSSAHKLMEKIGLR